MIETTKITGERKASSPTFWDASDKEFEENTEDETSNLETWTNLQKGQKIFEKLFTQVPAAYGSVQNLTKASKLPKSKVENFLADTDAHIKYRSPRKKNFLD